MAGTPQRFTPRAGSRMPGAVRRALDGHIDTDRRINKTLEVDRDGRMGAKFASGGGLKMTPQGLAVDPVAVGDKNNPAMAHQSDLASTATTADVVAAFNALLASMRKTKRMRG